MFILPYCIIIPIMYLSLCRKTYGRAELLPLLKALSVSVCDFFLADTFYKGPMSSAVVLLFPNYLLLKFYRL